ncbi:hypothetical protein AB0C76_39840 [Kitasatospora sp. NPDC048722]|uniref:hypothetical protein n=1 Tax=Kitasatospora sp. NPDC048722 TaxID=3155639 RepID=UPI0034070AF0
MTATNDAPDPHTTATAEERWQHIEDRLADIERRIREHGTAALATIDACLGRLDALRHDLAHRPWPPQAFPAPVAPPGFPPPPEQAPATGSPPATAGHWHTAAAPEPRHGSAGRHDTAVRAPA